MDNQVTSFDQLDAHLPGQVGVLEVGRVVDARSKQHNRRIMPPLRSQRPERAEQQLGVVFDRLHTIIAEQLREGPLHDAAAGEHIRNTARHPQIVFQDNEFAA